MCVERLAFRRAEGSLTSTLQVLRQRVDDVAVDRPKRDAGVALRELELIQILCSVRRSEH